VKWGNKYDINSGFETIHVTQTVWGSLDPEWHETCELHVGAAQEGGREEHDMHALLFEVPYPEPRQPSTLFGE
jgi:hypothetical protein